MPRKPQPRFQGLPEDRPIPKKHALFLRIYLEGGEGKITAKEAAIRAGYKGEAAAESAAAYILGRPNIKKFLDAQRAKVEEKHEITMDRIVAEFAKVAFSSMADFVVGDEDGNPRFKKLQEIRRQHLDAVSELTIDTKKMFDGYGEDREHVGNVEKVRFKLHSKLDALVDLAKLLGYFPAPGGGSDYDPDGQQSNAQKVVIEVVGRAMPKPRRKSDDV